MNVDEDIAVASRIADIRCVRRDLHTIQITRQIYEAAEFEEGMERGGEVLRQMRPNVTLFKPTLYDLLLALGSCAVAEMIFPSPCAPPSQELFSK